MYTTAMTEFIVAYILGLLGAASLTMAWFNSGLPVHIFAILEKLCLLPLWSDNDDIWCSTVSRNEWEDKVNIYLPSLLAELLTCKVCLSFHISLWIGILLAAIHPSVDWYHAFLTMFTWPILINCIVPDQH